MGDIAYSIDAWYPVVRGGESPRVLFNVHEARTPAKLEALWAGLPRGGRVVLRSTSPPGARGDLQAVEAALESSGSVERFIEFPGPEGSSILLPTVDAAALRGGMALLPRGRARGRTIWSLLRSASPFLVAQRLGRPEVAIWTKGQEQREENDLPVLPVAGSIAITIAHPDRSQKVIVRALDRRGAARVVLKIGTSERTDDCVEREARALEQVVELAPDRAPRLLAEGQRAGHSWLAQEVLEGRHGGELLSHAHAAFLAEFASSTRGEQPLQENRFFQDVQRHLAALDPLEDPDWHAEYTGLNAALKCAAEGHLLPTTLAHGDFTPWNLVRHRGEVRAFDWEHLAVDAPALHDLVHFHVQTGVLAKHQPGETIYEGLDRYFAGPANRVVRAAGLERADVLRLVALYILHEGTTAEVIDRARGLTTVDAGRLRHARRALCRRLTGLLTERSLPGWTRVDRDDVREAA